MVRLHGRGLLLPAFVFLGLLAARAQSDDLARKSEAARQLMAEGKFEAAIPVYQELVKALPQETGMLLNLALAQHMAGHEAEFRHALTHLLADFSVNIAWVSFQGVKDPLGHAKAYIDMTEAAA